MDFVLFGVSGENKGAEGESRDNTMQTSHIRGRENYSHSVSFRPLTTVTLTTSI